MRRTLLSLMPVLTVGFLAYAPAFAVTPPADLLQVYRNTADQDARIQAARHERQVIQEQIPQARAGLLPSLNAGASLEKSRQQSAGGLPDASRSGMVYQANLSQPLVRLDRWYALKAAEAGAAQANLTLAWKEQALILQSAEAYFDTLRALDAAAAAKAEVKALHRQRAQAQGRLEQGAANITDVLEAQAAHDAALANQKRAQREVADAFETLNRLTRQDYDRIVGVTHHLPINSPIPNDADAWVRQAIRSNLALSASSEAVSEAEQAHLQRKAGHAPTLDAVASYRKGDRERFGALGDISQSTIGLQLSIPLFAGGLTTSQVRESSQRLAQRESEHEDQRREVVQRTRSLHRAVNADIEQIQARQQSIRSSQAALSANQMGLTLGSRNTADVLHAERLLYRAVREYNDARYDYILDSLRLKQAAGSLALDDLQDLSRHLNRGYDPDRDFLPPQAHQPQPTTG